MNSRKYSTTSTLLNSDRIVDYVYVDV
jgi:hypothetical protein